MPRPIPLRPLRFAFSLLLAGAGLDGWVAARAAQDPAPERPSIQTTRNGARVLPLPREEGLFHFVVFGDRTGGPDNGVEVLARAVRETNLMAPDLVMTVGDLINGYNERDRWMAQMREYRSIMDGLQMPWFPVPGNHDIYWRGGETPEGHHEADYEKHFGPLWYWFEHRGCGFIALYSDESAPGTNLKGFGAGAWNQMSQAQLTWLEETLERTKKLRQVFVFLHHPRWIRTTYANSDWDVVHELLKRAGNVTAVFAGHIHRMRYEGKRDGIEYLTLASVGASMPFDIPGTGHLHHFNVVTVRERGIAIASVPVGAVLDPRSFTPEHLAEIDALRSATLKLEGRLRFGSDGEVADQLELRFTNPTQHRVVLETEIEFEGRGCFSTPRRMQRELEPGVSTHAFFQCERRRDGFAELFSAPTLIARTSWLGDDFRVDLPTQRIPIEIELADLPALALGTGHLELDGKNAAASVASAALALPDGPFTAEIWFQAKQCNGRTAALAKTESSEFGLYISDAKPSFLVHLDGGYRSVEASNATVPLDVPVHLAGVFDGAELRLYLNGSLVGRTEARGKRSTNDLPLWIGADPKSDGTPNSFLEGNVQRVRLSRSALYSGERFDMLGANAVPADPQGVLDLRFDRALGPYAVDRSKRSAHARLFGSARIRG